MAARGKAGEPDGIPAQTLLQESDASLMAAAQQVFGDDLAEPEPWTEPDITNPPSDEPAPKPRFQPTDESFVQLRGRGGGGAYLPARRRIMWMRGEPDEHPYWTIETQELQVVPGTFKSGNSVVGGYARIKASIYDETGRLIAQGTKTEFSERFMDFVEKAETGAIARALAVAGYGTEAALDLDEGVEDGRIADAPVSGSSAGRPIQITPSAVPGISAGGRSDRVTDAQIGEIARLTRELKLGLALTTVIESATGTAVAFPEGMKDPADMQKVIIATLKGLSFEDAGKIVSALSKAAASAAS